MRIELRALNVEMDKAFRALVERRLDFALGRFSEHLHEVTIRLEDINGMRQGPDKQCRMTVSLHGGGEVRVQATGSDLRTALDLAATRARQAVSRTVARRRTARSSAALRRARIETRAPLAQTG